MRATARSWKSAVTFWSTRKRIGGASERGRTAVRVLLAVHAATGGDARQQSIDLLHSKGIDAVIPFRTMLSDLIDPIEGNRNYQKSDLLQVIRILKNYDLFAPPQLELFDLPQPKRKAKV